MFDVLAFGGQGDGWKELRFITQKVALLIEDQGEGYDRIIDNEVIVQPDSWEHESSDAVMKRRWGESASVKFFMIKKEYKGVEGAVLHPEKREEVLYRDKHMLEYFYGRDFWCRDDWSWDELPHREVMAIFRVGENTPYVVPYIEGVDIVQDFVMRVGWKNLIEQDWVKDAVEHDGVVREHY